MVTNCKMRNSDSLFSSDGILRLKQAAQRDCPAYPDKVLRKPRYLTLLSTGSWTSRCPFKTTWSCNGKWTSCPARWYYSSRDAWSYTVNSQFLDTDFRRCSCHREANTTICSKLWNGSWKGIPPQVFHKFQKILNKLRTLNSSLLHYPRKAWWGASNTHYTALTPPQFYKWGFGMLHSSWWLLWTQLAHSYLENVSWRLPSQSSTCELLILIY